MMVGQWHGRGDSDSIPRVDWVSLTFTIAWLMETLMWSVLFKNWDFKEKSYHRRVDSFVCSLVSCPGSCGVRVTNTWVTHSRSLGARALKGRSVTCHLPDMELTPLHTLHKRFFLLLFFFLINLFYLFVFGRVGFSLRCRGFSLRWLLLLQSMGSSRVGFSSCGSWALECRLSSCGARA